MSQASTLLSLLKVITGFLYSSVIILPALIFLWDASACCKAYRLKEYFQVITFNSTLTNQIKEQDLFSHIPLFLNMSLKPHFHSPLLKRLITNRHTIRFFPLILDRGHKYSTTTLLAHNARLKGNCTSYFSVATTDKAKNYTDFCFFFYTPFLFVGSTNETWNTLDFVVIIQSWLMDLVSTLVYWIGGSGIGMGRVCVPGPFTCCGLWFWFGLWWLHLLLDCCWWPLSGGELILACFPSKKKKKDKNGSQCPLKLIHVHACVCV